MELKDYLGVVRARKWLILLVAISTAAVAVVLALLQVPTYEAQATILVTNQQNAGSVLLRSPLPDQSVEPNFVATQVRLIQSPFFAEQVIRTLRLDTTPDDLMGHITVTQVGQTDVIVIAVTDTTPMRASQTADALADAYVAWSRDIMRSSIKTAADAVANSQAQASKEASATLAGQLEQLRIAEQLAAGSALVIPGGAGSPASTGSDLGRNGGLGMLVGLLFGLGVAGLAEYFDTTIRTTEEAEEIFRAPVLARIPAGMLSGRKPSGLAVMQDPAGSMGESYRVLRNNLESIASERGVKTLLVATAGAAEAASDIASNVAAVLAQGGKRVALIMCDFRRPLADQIFDVDGAVDLSSELVGTGGISDAVEQPRGFDSLWVLTAGEPPSDSSALLGSARMEQLVQSLSESFDWIVMDAPALLAGPDAAAAARWADGVLVVIRGGVTTRGDANRSSQTLEKIGARILGIVAWGSERYPEIEKREHAE